MKKCFLVLFLISVFSLLSRANETRPPYSTIEIQVGPELKTVGDFVLKDKQGAVYAVGRLLVDFSSIYTILAQGNEARGDCEYLFVSMKNGEKVTKASVHLTRYFINIGKSTIRMNTDVPDSEFIIDLDFDLKHEIATGVIRRHADAPEEGSFQMRIQDIPTTGKK